MGCSSVMLILRVTPQCSLSAVSKPILRPVISDEHFEDQREPLISICKVLLADLCLTTHASYHGYE